MAYIEGRLSSLEVDGTNIVGITDASLTLTATELETSVHGTEEYRSFIAGRKDGTLSVSILFNDGDAGQQKLINSFDPNDSSMTEVLAYAFKISTAGGGSDDLYSADGLITDLSFSTPNDDITTIDVTIRLTGNVTIA